MGSLLELDLDLSTLPDEAGIYWLQRETGALPDNHLLVQLMRSAMLGSIGRSPTSDELPTLEGLAQLEKVHVAWREEGVGRDLLSEVLQRESRSGDSRWGAAE